MELSRGHRVVAGLLAALGSAGLPACAPPDLVADAGPDVLAFVGEPVVLEVQSHVRGVEATWRFEDGSQRVGSAVSFTPETVGWHTVTLELQDGRGGVDTDILVVRAGPRPSAVPPRVSGRIARVEGGGLLVAVPGTAHIAEVHGAAVSTRPVCAEPTSVAVQGDRVAVACEQDEIAVFRRSSASQVTLELPWGTRPGGLLWMDDQLRLAARGPQTVQRLDEEGVLLEDVAVHAPFGLALIEGQTTVVSTSQGAGVARLEPLGETELSTSPGPDSDTNARGVPSGMRAMAVRHDAAEVVLGGHKANLERGAYRDGLPLTFETTARSVLRAIDPETLEERWHHFFDNRDRVTALSYSAHGDLLYVGHGAGVVDVLDAGTRQRLGGFTGFGAPVDDLVAFDESLWVLVGLERRLYQIPSEQLVGQARDLNVFDLLQDQPELHSETRRLGERLFHASADVRVSRDGYLSCASCHPDGEQDGLTWDFTDRGEGLRNTPSLRGRMVGPIHWTGNFDELQDFEEDVRLSQGGHGFLSEEEWARTSDALGAGKQGLSAELDALATYMAELSPLRSPFRASNGALTADGAAGEALFLGAGCADCHPPPEYTDSAWQGEEPLLHDVGTLGPGSGSRRGEALTGLDTPSLRGVWGSAPYLHDGRAETLRQVLVEANLADAHGRTSDLSEEELSLLEAFLRQIE